VRRGGVGVHCGAAPGGGGGGAVRCFLQFAQGEVSLFWTTSSVVCLVNQGPNGDWRGE